MSVSKTKCAAVNCTSSTSVTHKFPKDYKRCRIWAERAGCLHLLEKGVDVLHASYSLCSDHFHDTSYISHGRKHLSIYALPEIFPEVSGTSEDANLPTVADFQPINELKLESSSEVNIDLLCRICACASDELVPVFDEKGLEQQLLEKIHIHLPIMITPQDMLPVTLCTSCIWKLELCHEFVCGCLEADAKLRTLLGLKDNTEEAYSGEDGTEPQYDMVQNSTEIKDVLHDTETNTLKDSPMNEVDSCCIQNTDVIQSTKHQLDALDVEDTQVLQDTNEQVQCHSIDCYQDNDNTMERRASYCSSNLQDVDGDNKQETVVQEDYCDKLSHYQKKNDVDHVSHNPASNIHNQSTDHNFSAEPTSASLEHLNLEGRVLLTKCKMIKENSNFKVIVVKMKTATNVKSELKTDNIPDVRKNAETINPAAIMRTSKQHEEEEQNLSTLNSNIEMASFLNENSLKLPALRTTNSDNLKQNTTAALNEIETKGSSRISITGNISEDTSREFITNAQVPSDQKTIQGSEIYQCCHCHSTHLSEHLLEQHKISCPNNLNCAIASRENLLNPESPSLQPVVILERLPYFPESDTELKHLHNVKETEADEHISFKTCSNNSSTIGSLSETFLNENAPKENKEQERFETVAMTPECSNSNEKDSLINSSSVEKCKDFENTDSDRAKIIESIDNIIKRNEAILLETATKKVVKSIVPNKELIQKLTKAKPCMPHIKLQKKVHKFWKCMQCFHVFNTERALETHTRLKHPIMQLCQYCDKKFDSSRRFERHISMHVREKKYMCEFCGRNFRLKRSLQNHLYLHNTEEMKFTCKKCGKKFVTKERFLMHCVSHDRASSYLCDICGKSMKYFNSLKVHRRMCIDPSLAQQFCCTTCGKTYRDKRAFADHMRLHTNERPFICTQCGDSFRMRIQLSCHMLRHNNAVQHKCPICGKGFNRRQHMRVHVLIHQRPNKYTCGVCEQTFVYMRELNNHQTNHTKEEIDRVLKSKRKNETSKKLRTYVCQICGKHLANSATLKNHVMTHADEKPFCCEICGKRFSLASKLKIHQHIHSDSKPFACELCEKSFTNKTQLYSHRYIHTGEKPYKCHYCTKRYPFRQNLIIHERLHTGERPFKCKICNKGFCSQNSLKAHALVHSDHRPFQCVHCYKSFKRQDILDTHMRIHTGERPFLCNICGRGFKQNGDCRKHEQTHLKSSSSQNTTLSSCILLTDENNMTQ